VLIYILRHGIAEDAPAGGSDAARALTQEGKQKLRKVLACARQAGVGPSLILSSPLKRAVQTAEIAVEVLNVKREIVQTAALAPSGSLQRVWNEVHAQDADELLIAGHEPLLGRFVAFLLRCPALRVQLKKGALVCIDIETVGPEPHGVLRWMLTPKLAGQ
jgi:phosphohistidine phosphatase